jgi:MOSC domain-containing protein YiiM
MERISMATVISVCISNAKGTIKTSVPEIYAKTGYGIEGDAHAGEGHRQVSLLAVESADKLRSKITNLEAGIFAENILTSGICLYKIPIGVKLYIGEVILEVSQIGKECHNEGCVIKHQTGECVMPREGIFASVLQGGTIRPGDGIRVEGKYII